MASSDQFQLLDTALAARQSCKWSNPTPIKKRSPLDSYFLLDYLLTASQRLAKWFTTLSPKEKSKIVKDVSQLVLARRTRMCNFLEYKGEEPNPLIESSFTDNIRLEDCLSTLCLPLFHCRLRLNR